MRKFFANLFFWNAPAAGAVFALTFAVIGSVLWLGLLHILVLLEIISFTLLPAWDGTISTVWLVWGAGQLSILLYSAVVFIRALWRFASNMKQTRDFRPLCWLPAILLCGGIGSVGVYCVENLLTLMLKIFDFSGETPGTNDLWLPKLLGFSGDGWGWIFGAALLFLVAGYLMAAKMFAAGEKRNLRQAFGRATLILWGIFLIGYVISLGCAFYASRNVVKAERELEQRFNRPLTAAGLWKLYQENGRIDGEFWKKSLAAYDRLPGTLTVGAKAHKSWDFVLPDRLTPEIMTAFNQYCAANAEALAAWESAFDTVPPLPERKFEPGNLVGMYLPEFSKARSWVRLENSRLLAVLNRKNLPEALKAYRRLSNCCEYLRHEPLLIGSLVWIALENIRLHCIEILLESRLLSEPQLLAIDADLQKLEEKIPENHQQAMYSEAVFGLDVIYGLETGKITDSRIGWGQFRWFFPLMWIHAAQDKEYLIRTHLTAADFTQMDTKRAALKPYILSAMLSPLLNNAGKRFYALTARTRAMRTVIRAELHRRKYGDFPATLDALPPDPFTGKPLQYRVGETTVAESFWKDSEANLQDATAIRPVRAIQVWSVGPDGQDNGGADYREPDSERKKHDDVRALILTESLFTDMDPAL